MENSRNPGRLARMDTPSRVSSSERFRAESHIQGPSGVQSLNMELDSAF